MQSNLFLPEAYGDFIFAILGEEFGLIGSIAVLFAYLVFLVCGILVAKKSKDMFGQLLAFGITISIVFYAFVNIAVTTGVFPTTGLPLPFISYGGTSLIFLCISVGILINIAIYKSYASERNCLRSGSKCCARCKQMSNVQSKYKFLFAGGGTGGHLFPAVAVAEQIRELKPEADILFIGTKDRIEGRVVPKLGFKFKSIWIKGFSRKINFENLLFPLKLFVSLIQSLIINISFKPKVAIGSGGYVAGPAIWAASVMGAKVILLEQNSYPGVTTRLLERYANEVHLSFEESKKYLRKEKIHHFTGNPVRKNLGRMEKAEALKRFELFVEKKTLLILGGSLGAKTINETMSENIKYFVENNIQVIWQTGKNYFERFKDI